MEVLRVLISVFGIAIIFLIAGIAALVDAIEGCEIDPDEWRAK